MDTNNHQITVPCRDSTKSIYSMKKNNQRNPSFYIPRLSRLIPDFPHKTYGAFADWGSFIGHGISLNDCLQRCQNSQQCLGVDYFTPIGGACFHHNSTTYCKPNVEHMDFNRYRKLPCLGEYHRPHFTLTELYVYTGI